MELSFIPKPCQNHVNACWTICLTALCYWWNCWNIALMVYLNVEQIQYCTDCLKYLAYSKSLYWSVLFGLIGYIGIIILLYCIAITILNILFRHNIVGCISLVFTFHFSNVLFSSILHQQNYSSYNYFALKNGWNCQIRL